MAGPDVTILPFGQAMETAPHLRAWKRLRNNEATLHPFKTTIPQGWTDVDAIFAVRRMHEHRIWANRSLFQAASKLDDESLHKEFPIGQGTVWKSLAHMWGAETVWIEALQGNEAAIPPGDDPTKLPGNQLGQDGMRSLSELGTRWEALHARWNEWLSTLTDDQLTRPVWRRSNLFNPPKRAQSGCYDVLLHVCLHAHWTAAQVVNMMRSLGVQPLPNVMHISMARQQLGQ